MNHNAVSHATEETSEGSPFILIVSQGVGLAAALWIGWTYGLFSNGIYGVVEFIGLIIAAIYSFFNYHRYVSSIKELDLPKNCRRCIHVLHWHFAFCVVIFFSSGALIISHAPAVWVMLTLSAIYYVYLRSNYSVISALSLQEVTEKIKVTPANLVPRYINSVSNSAFFLKQENSVSFIGYISLTVFCAVIYVLSVWEAIPKKDADALGAFAAGAAVVHLGFSSVKFRKIVWNYREPKSGQSAAVADIIELVLFIVGDDTANRGARADRAADVATHLKDGKIFRKKARKWLGLILTTAMVLSALAVATGAAKRVYFSPNAGENEQESDGNRH